jgi:acyl-CoA reductase-like NAD-dependent aldehyde dehydrogenase
VEQIPMTIGGAAVTGDHPVEVINPATGRPCGLAPAGSATTLDAAMRAAARAWPEWSEDRPALPDRLRAAARAVSAAASRIGELLAREQGKPLPLAVAETHAAAAMLRHYAGLELPVEVVQDDRRGYAELVRRPLGVVAAVTPWNFPVAAAAAKLAPALRAGNAVVLKPAPETPLSTLELGRVLAGVLPPGVVNVVSGDDRLGAAMVAHPVPRMVSLTGSVPTGRRAARRAGAGLKRCLLELGGNDPGILLDDVDPGQVAERLFWAAFANNGQACLLVKRLYVPERLHHPVVEALAEQARRVRVGDPLAAGTQLGPVTTLRQYRRIHRLVRGAVAAGARAACGGGPLPGPGYFYPPTVLAGADDRMPVVAEEQFGPVLPVVPYRDLAEAVRRANATEFGLGGSVWSADPERAERVAARLECGTVWVNSHAVLGPDQPVAGWKASGIGVEGGRLGLAEYTAVQVRHRPVPPGRRPAAPAPLATAAGRHGG